MKMKEEKMIEKREERSSSEGRKNDEGEGEEEKETKEDKQKEARMEVRSIIARISPGPSACL